MIPAYFRGTPDDPGHDLHLFLDDFAIEDRWDATRVQNEAVRHPHNPVLVADLPWERTAAGPNVLHDEEENLFRMWYVLASSSVWTKELSGRARAADEYGAYLMSYAESDDGVHWRKPLTDRFPYRGYDRTNIVLTGRERCQEFSVTWTPAPMADRGRFMCVYKDVGHREYAQADLNDYPVKDAVCLAFSDDGVDWRIYEGNPIHPALDSKYNLYWDARLEHWIMSGRPFARAATEQLQQLIGRALRSGQALTLAGGIGAGEEVPGTAEAGIAGIGRAGAVENVRTRISIHVSPDLKTWYPPREVLMPDAADDSEQMFFDHMTMQPYGSQYLGYLGVQPRDGTGHSWIELTASPDGMQWHRPRDRKPFLPRGPEGSWDAGHVWAIRAAVPYGEWLYMYYSGSSRPWRYRFPDNNRSIGLARIRRDRFVGYHGDVNGGHLLSREVKVAGPRLLVNCSAEHRAFSREWHGSLHTELVDRAGRAIPGYTYAECDPNHVDDTATPITWRGKDLSALVGQAVYIRFFMRNSYVFGFRFAEAGS